MEPRDRAAAPAGDDRHLLPRLSARRWQCSGSSRPGSFPIRTTTRCSSTCRRRRARRSTTCRNGRSRSPTSSSRTRTSTRSWRVSAAAGRRGREQRPHQRAARAARQARSSRRSRSRSSSGRCCSRYPGFRGFVGLPPSLQIGGRMGNQNFSIMMQAMNTDELYAWGPQLEQAVTREVSEVQDVSTDMEMKSPRIDLVINRDKAAMVGLNATTIQNALYDALGPKWSSTIYGNTAQYRVLRRARSEISGARRVARESGVPHRRPADSCRCSRSSTSRRRSVRSRSITPDSCRRCRSRSA